MSSQKEVRSRCTVGCGDQVTGIGGTSEDIWWKDEEERFEILLKRQLKSPGQVSQ